MVAEPQQITSLRKPPEGYFWTTEARERRRANLDVYNSRAKGGELPWQDSPTGPRPDAEPTKDLPTLTPGVDRLPQRCIFCRSALLDKRECAGGEQRGTLTCTGCSRQLAWLAPRITAGSAPVSDSSVIPARPAIHGAEPPRAMRRAMVSGFGRKEGCGPACGPVMGHEPDAHERFGRERALAELVVAAARPSGTVRTGSLAVDFDAIGLTVDGKPITVTETEWRVLAHLAARLNTCCTHFEIVESVWDRATAEQWGVPDGRGSWHGVRVHFSRLRSKLGAAAALIETRPGFGFRLRAEPPIGIES
jgi:DNA-binding winged helix-turn-helix (wHTH) protein